ncbi:MAG: monovalent cation/H(+) antiporter subunit G [Candidatus Omnitrophica bacterium]|nr:monovalent cation/H(+) antiporter subunit G [Candidatus Omnitrophota bacterium]MBU1366593.1 monovalent cation/H(+) antiporter subunit G [Candidatus Omnitrophota bacterium]MBU1523144.1 monovalent cation/H(+) antiporter subunit G [Candidatus Omnitrophota bacterium]MBU2436276.1 monovalent cation/H(+) antiporter subunit G [Candidatus Omnitrophota bacterium]MBU2504545.1 monovalent cation/H(+) antiporter subunit G [Candidatus Omnitrophota bacterium]
MIEIIGLIFITIGLAFDLFGCLGLIRLPDVYNRLQAATKCVTLGTCSILFGTFLIVGPVASGMKALLCMVFLLLTAPVSAHAISRGAHKAGVRLCEGSVIDKYEEDKQIK